MGKRMHHGRGDLRGVRGSDGDSEKSVVLEGLAGVIEDRERGEWRRSEPLAEKRRYGIGGGCVGRDRLRPLGNN